MSEPVRIPADVERPDRVLANLTGRQLAILAGAAAVLYLAWTATRTVVPPLLFLTLAGPVAAAAATLALGTRDGISLDRLAVAALRQRLAPTHRVTAPEGILPAPIWLAAAAATGSATADESAAGAGPGAREGRVSPAPLRLPAQAVHAAQAVPAASARPTGDVAVIDLGGDGLAVVAVCSTVNFALRTPAEQDGLVAVFARWLHSLSAGVQILVRAERLDLSAQIAELRERAPGLPHPALEAAAADHADYLDQLAERADLLRRQVLLVLREPAPVTVAGGPLAASPIRLPVPGRRRALAEAEAGREAWRRAAEARLARRLAEAGQLLAPAGITVTGLDPTQAAVVLAAACNPDSLLRPGAGIAGLAAADEVITTAPEDPDTSPAGPVGVAGLGGSAGTGQPAGVGGDGAGSGSG